eukprot:Nk52_evm78s1810 gene=Nk52_evmTU78s1810
MSSAENCGGKIKASSCVPDTIKRFEALLRQSQVVNNGSFAVLPTFFIFEVFLLFEQNLLNGTKGQASCLGSTMESFENFGLDESFCLGKDAELVPVDWEYYSFNSLLLRSSRMKILFDEDWKQFMYHFRENENNLMPNLFEVFHRDMVSFSVFHDLPSFLFNYVQNHPSTFNVDAAANQKGGWVLPLLRFADIQNSSGVAKRKDMAVLSAALQNAYFFYNMPGISKMPSKEAPDDPENTLINTDSLLNTLFTTRKCFVSLGILAYTEKSLLTCIMETPDPTAVIDTNSAKNAFKAFPDIHKRLLIYSQDAGRGFKPRHSSLVNDMSSPIMLFKPGSRVISGSARQIGCQDFSVALEYSYRLCNLIKERAAFSHCQDLLAHISSLRSEERICSHSCNAVILSSHLAECDCDSNMFAMLIDKSHLYFPSSDVLDFDYYLKLGCSSLASKSYVKRFGTFGNGHELGCIAAYNLAMSKFDDFIVICTCYQFIECLEEIYFGSESYPEQRFKWASKLLIDSFAAKRIFDYSSKQELIEITGLCPEENIAFKDLVGLFFEYSYGNEYPLGSALPGNERITVSFRHDTFSSELVANVSPTLILKCLEAATLHIADWKSGNGSPFILENWWNLPLAYSFVNKLTLSSSFAENCFENSDLICLLYHLDKHGFEFDLLNDLMNEHQGKIPACVSEHLRSAFTPNSSSRVSISKILAQDDLRNDVYNYPYDVHNTAPSSVEKTKANFYQRLGIRSRPDADSDADANKSFGNERETDSVVSSDSEYMLDPQLPSLIKESNLFTVIKKWGKCPESSCKNLLKCGYFMREPLLILVGGSQSKVDMLRCLCMWITLASSAFSRGGCNSSGQSSPANVKRDLRNSQTVERRVDEKVLMGISDLERLIMSDLEQKSYMSVLNACYIFCFDSPLYYLLFFCYAFRLKALKECTAISKVLSVRLNAAHPYQKKFGWEWQREDKWINHFCDAVCFLELKSYKGPDERNAFCTLVLNSNILTSDAVIKSFKRHRGILHSMCTTNIPCSIDITEEEYIERLVENGMYEEALYLSEEFSLPAESVHCSYGFSMLKEETVKLSWGNEKSILNIFGKISNMFSTKAYLTAHAYAFFVCLLSDGFQSAFFRNIEVDGIDLIRPFVLLWATRSQSSGALVCKDPFEVFKDVFSCMKSTFCELSLESTSKCGMSAGLQTKLSPSLLTCLLNSGCFVESMMLLEPKDSKYVVDLAYTAWCLACEWLVPEELPFSIRLLLREKQICNDESDFLCDAVSQIKQLSLVTKICEPFCRAIALKCTVARKLSLTFLQLQEANPSDVFANIFLQGGLAPLANSYAELEMIDFETQFEILVPLCIQDILCVAPIDEISFKNIDLHLCTSDIQRVDSVIELFCSHSHSYLVRVAEHILLYLKQPGFCLSQFQKAVLLRFACHYFHATDCTHGLEKCIELGRSLSCEYVREEKWLLLTYMMIACLPYVDFLFIFDVLLDREKLIGLNMLLCSSDKEKIIVDQLVNHMQRRLCRRSLVRSFLAQFYKSNLLIDWIISESKHWFENFRRGLNHTPPSQKIEIYASLKEIYDRGSCVYTREKKMHKANYCSRMSDALSLQMKHIDCALFGIEKDKAINLVCSFYKFEEALTLARVYEIEIDSLLPEILLRQIIGAGNIRYLSDVRARFSLPKVLFIEIANKAFAIAKNSRTSSKDRHKVLLHLKQFIAEYVTDVELLQDLRESLQNYGVSTFDQEFDPSTISAALHNDLSCK